MTRDELSRKAGKAYENWAQFYSSKWIEEALDVILESDTGRNTNKPAAEIIEALDKVGIRLIIRRGPE